MPVPVPLNWGVPSAGGPIITAGGLIFIGATADSRFRAYDIDTGEELWTDMMPTSAMATPMTYEADGRQFVVIAAGGAARGECDQGQQSKPVGASHAPRHRKTRSTRQHLDIATRAHRAAIGLHNEVQAICTALCTPSVRGLR